jgi:hypothetical protein
MELIGYNYYNIILWKKNGRDKYYPKNLLSFDLADEQFDYLLFLKFENQHPYSIPDIDHLINSLETIYQANKDTFVVLTSKKAPPLYTANEDEFVYSFSCKYRHFKQSTAFLDKESIISTDLLFTLLDRISNGNSDLEKVLIRQVPIAEPEELTPVSPFDVIIPHRGNNSYLKNVLFFTSQIHEANIYTGIDQNVTAEILEIRKDYPESLFYHFAPDPVGPYVIRNMLIQLGSNELIFFQDADDIPAADRFEKISDYMKNSRSQLCGSHELRMDYYTRKVLAVRFPIDVMSALDIGPGHPLLHPTSAITRKAFYECGKLSQDRSFGNDTKFLLHSFFILNTIKNIDEFLYIRKRHPESLTTSPGTMLGSPVRQQLQDIWNYDFERIKAGKLKLEDSRLNYEDSKLPIEMKQF